MNSTPRTLWGIVVSLLVMMACLLWAPPTSAASLPSAPPVTWVLAGGGTATLHWAPPTSAGSAPEGISDYRIDYSSDGGGSWAMVTLSTGSSLTGWGTADISYPLDPASYVLGTSYQFRVAAITSVGTGPWSPASGTFIRSTTPTEPVLSAAVTPGNGQASLQWCCSSNQGSVITGYSIKASADAGATWAMGVANTGSAALSGTVTGLINGRTYVFQVAAINANGTGAWSATSNPATPTGPPDAVTWGSATAGPSRAQLTWSAPANTGGSPITAYTVQSSNDTGATWTSAVPNTGGIGTSATVAGLTNGTAYVFRIAAISALGTGAWSVASASVTPANAGSGSSSGTPGSGTPSTDSPTGGNSSTPVPTTSGCAAPRSLGRGITLIAWPGCGVKATRVSATAATRSAGQAHTARVKANRVVAIGVSHLPKSAPLTVRMQIGRLWKDIGSVRSSSRGTATCPAFKASRAGQYPVEMTTANGARYYVTVTVSQRA